MHVVKDGDLQRCNAFPFSHFPPPPGHLDLCQNTTVVIVSHVLGWNVPMLSLTGGVFCLGCRYLMFYEAVAGDGRRSIGVAVSPDGIRGWKRMDRCAPCTQITRALRS